LLKRTVPPRKLEAVIMTAPALYTMGWASLLNKEPSFMNIPPVPIDRASEVPDLPVTWVEADPAWIA
jgi:hypothetical protein